MNVILSNSAAPGRQDLAKYNTRPTVFVKALTHDHNNKNAFQYCVPSKRVAAASLFFKHTHTQTHIVTIK